MRSLRNDLNFGLGKEMEIVDMLQFNFCDLYDEDEFKNTKDLYQDDFYPYDFEGMKNGTSIELKSRRVKKNTYPTTIIPVCKVRNTSKKQLFIFNFTDNCSYIEYDAEVFSKYKIADVTTERWGVVDNPKPHYFIEIKDLKDLINIYTNI